MCAVEKAKINLEQTADEGWKRKSSSTMYVVCLGGSAVEKSRRACVRSCQKRRVSLAITGRKQRESGRERIRKWLYPAKTSHFLYLSHTHISLTGHH